MDEMMSLYIDDTREYLAILDESIIAFEKCPDDHAAICEMFRAYHTMKSSTAAMDFKRTADFIHHMEDLLHEMREGRIEINPSIIQLLYESHDYLEEFLKSVMDNGKEGDLQYGPLIGEVEKVIMANRGLVEKGKVSNIIMRPENVFVLTERDLQKAVNETSDGNRLYKINVKLAADCAFKAVRAWMIFEDISKVSKVICSNPEKPEPDAFMNGTFQFDDTEIQVFVAADIPLNDLYQELAVNLNEVESLFLEEAAPGFAAGTSFSDIPALTGMVKQYIRLQDDNISDIVDRIIGPDMAGKESDLLSGILAEIVDKIRECEYLLLEFEMKQYNPEIMSELSCRFLAVKELADYTGNGVISDISLRICSLADMINKQQLEPDIVLAGLLADLLKFIKRLCSSPELTADVEFQNEVNHKVKLLNEFQSLADRLKVQECGTEPAKLGELLVKTGSLKVEDVNDIIHLQKERYPDLKFGEIAVKENKADTKDVLGALHLQENSKSDQKSQAYIRIQAYKVDNMVDHLGELLITQSLHKQEILSLLNKDGGKAMNNIIRMERIAKEIQEITMSLRMVSLKQTFQKIYRIGRDTAAELGREIVMETSGDDTEIDRNIVDKIHDPMMHLIRNAVSHGIEEAGERKAAGKPAAGRVTITACNRRGNVYIEIKDDGRGLSVEKIFKKALERELIDPQRKYTEDEILKFIYLPGFSTQEKVNSISGRGVGMNVVQTEIMKLGGKIDIDNNPGCGCTFVLKIPVNLATINGTIVEISGNNYIVPTLNIKQILKPQEDQWISIKGVVSAIAVRNEIIPLIPVGNIMLSGTDTTGNCAELVITVEHDRKLKALPVRAILGKQEVVVKQLGSDFGNLDFITGATILGDGRVSLILDIEALFKLTEDAVRVT